MDTSESNKAFENIVTATHDRAVANRQAQSERQKKENEENERLAKSPQQTDFTWPSTTKEVLKDQLKKYRQLLDKPDFLGNISGNRESLIEQYNQAVVSWTNQQKGAGKMTCAYGVIHGSF